MAKHSSGKQLTNAVLIPVLAIISGLLVASLFLLVSGSSPLRAYQELFKAGFSCSRLTNCNLFQTLQLATPLILTGLSAVMAFRSGMFSLGQEGQFLIGATIAAWLGYAIHLPPVLHPIVIMAAAMLGAGLYGWFPGVLKTRLGINEVITTIVLNNIANLFMTYAVNFPMRADQGTTAHSPLIDDAAVLPAFVQGSKMGIGLVIAFVAAGLVYIYLWRTIPGYEQRMAGQVPLFARFSGIRNEGAALRGVALSGAIAGLAGAIEILGVHHRLLQGFSTGLGWDGVMVAILGQVHPVGVAIVAVFFAGMRLGAQIGLQAALQVPRELGGGLIALMILFVAVQNLYRGWIEGGREWFQKRVRRGDPVQK